MMGGLVSWLIVGSLTPPVFSWWGLLRDSFSAVLREGVGGGGGSRVGECYGTPARMVPFIGVLPET